MKKLTIFEVGSKGQRSREIVAGEKTFFSSLDLKSIALEDGNRSDTLKLKIRVYTKYSMPEGTYCPRLEVSNFNAIKGINYKKLVESLTKTTKEGKTFTAAQVRALVKDGYFTAINCDVTFPNGEVAKGYVDVEGTLGNWHGDWKQGKETYEMLRNKPELIQNIARILETTMDTLRGRVVLFHNYKTGVKKEK